MSHAEAPFSSNFRMYTDEGADFLFTVREMTATELMKQVQELIVIASEAGWRFRPAAVQPGRPAAQAVTQQPVPLSGQQPAGLPQPATQPAYKQPAPAGTQKTDLIDGYIVGQYHSKRTNRAEPCVWLYTARRPYKAYTIYPENFAALPFPVKPGNQLVMVAPGRDQAIAMGVYTQHQFELLVEPDLDADGNQKLSKNGYPEWRPVRAGTQPPPPQPVAQPAQNGDVDFGQKGGTHASGNAAPFLGADASSFPTRSDAPGEDALAWTMQDADDAIRMMNLEENVGLWLQAYRDRVVAYMPMGGKKTQDNQWAMLNAWCAEQVGVADPATTLTVKDVGELPLAGLLVGILCDRYAEKPAETPIEVALDVLRRTQKLRGTEANPTYDAAFAGALSLVLRTEYNRILADGTLAF